MNIFGFNIGGPVTFGHLYNPDKNKTFFFYNMEWRRYIDGGSTNQTVPDPATYGGDFSSVTDPILVPTAARVAPSVLFANCPGGVAPAGVVQGAQFPGNVIPGCMIQPNATALLGTGFLPAPNSGIGNGVGSFVGGSSTPTNLKEEIVRVDHTFNSKFSVFGHFIAEQISQGYNTAQWSGDNLPTVGDTFNNPAYSYVIHATHTISPTLLNEIAFNYNGNRINIIPFAATGMTSLALPSGYDATNSRLFTGPNNLDRIPNITLNHQSNANFQIASWPWVNRADGYQIRDDVSWTQRCAPVSRSAEAGRATRKSRTFSERPREHSRSRARMPRVSPETASLTSCLAPPQVITSLASRTTATGLPFPGPRTFKTTGAQLAG